MLALSCCPSQCGDVVFSEFEEWVYPHTGVWECEKPNPEEDLFYKYFFNLPYEMKVHVLSYCRFHVLLNKELWLGDIDHLHFGDVMRDHHITRRPCHISRGFLVCDDDKCRVCENGVDLHTYTLNKDENHIHIGLSPQSYVLFKTDQPTQSMVETDARFGRRNRYPACYYRNCRHFSARPDHKPLSEEEIAERWKRLCHAKKKEPTKSVGATLPSASRYAVEFSTMDKLNPVPQSYNTRIKLEPGAYYWELINYNFEEEMAAIGGGEKSRQRHFLLDPSSASTVSTRIYMSLMYRRIVHPNVEGDDEFTTIAYFEKNETTNDEDYFQSLDLLINQKSRITPETVVSFVFDAGEDTADKPFVPMYKRNYLGLVYRHVLTPTFGVQIYRALNETRKNLQYYNAVIPGNATIHSIDHNSTTVRLNFFIESKNTTIEERDTYGVAIARAVQDENLDSYAFTSSSFCHETGDGVCIFDHLYKH